MFDEKENGVLVRVRIIPNSSCKQICGLYEDANNVRFLKIKICSAPENGKANAEVQTFLAKTLKCAKSEVRIVSGHKDRVKNILIEGETKLLAQKLNALLGD